MNALLLSLIGAGGLASGGLMSWLIARRTSSGNVSTSDAKTVFEEQRALLAMMREDRTEMNGRIQIMEERQVLDLRNVVRLETVVANFTQAFEECKADLLKLRAELDESKAHLAEVRAKLVIAKKS